MKRVFVIVLSVVTLVVAAPAPASGQTVKSLARQVKALQKEVKTLKKQVTAAQELALFVGVYSACTTAVTADAIQGTWTTMEQQLGRTVFGPQTPVNDYRTCQPLRITRAPTQSPPNASVFNSLLALFRTR